MKLTELDPQFRLWRADGALGKVDSINQAQGITFECPCQSDTHSAHWILVWFKGRGVPAEAEPVARWNASGTGYEDLTLTPSVDCTKGDPTCWHGHITAGQIVGGI